MPLTWTAVQWPFLITVIIALSVFLTAIWKALDALRAITAPFRQFVGEHDVMWEDYNIRTGGTYRRAIGRGAPPDPEEYYERLRRSDAAG
jgi:hypothetical protein